MTGPGLDQLFRRTEGSTVNDYLTDALGSTIALTDGAGVVQTSYSYEAYGQTTAGGMTSNNPYQYTGRENDGTGLYYYRNRYYSPAMRRFISEDPIGFAAGQNVYAYVEGNPISLIDPLGLIAGTASRSAAVAAAAFGGGSASTNTTGVTNVANITGSGSSFGGNYPGTRTGLPPRSGRESNDDTGNDADEDDCGCWRILERHSSWWDGDRVYYEYLACLRQCKKECE